MAVQPNSSSEPPREPPRDPRLHDSLLEGRYKVNSRLAWRSRSPAPVGTHTHRAGVLAGLALIALAVLAVLLHWNSAITIACATVGGLYLLFGIAGRP